MTVLSIAPKAPSAESPSLERVLHVSPTSFKFFFALGLLVLLEVALFFLSATDFVMTRAGLIRHGTEADKAFYLAITIAIFMFLMWTGILNLGPLHRLKGFLAMIPVMLLLIVASYGGAGQWIMIELAGVDATRQASNALKREVAAYLAPAEKPGQILDALHRELARVRESFQEAGTLERSGGFTGRAGSGPAVARLGNVASTVKGAEDYVADLNRRWRELTGAVDEKMRDLTQRVEKGGVVSAGEVESTLQEVIRNMSAFPFASVRPQVEAVISSAQQAAGSPASSTLPPGTNPDAYRQLYSDLSQQVATLKQTVGGLLDQIEAFKLGPQPRLEVQSIRSVVYANPWTYVMDIVHSIVLVSAPLLYACGPAQIIHAILMPAAVPRRRDEPEAAEQAA